MAEVSAGVSNAVCARRTVRDTLLRDRVIARDQDDPGFVYFGVSGCALGDATRPHNIRGIISIDNDSCGISCWYTRTEMKHFHVPRLTGRIACFTSRDSWYGYAVIRHTKRVSITRVGIRPNEDRCTPRRAARCVIPGKRGLVSRPGRTGMRL